MIVLGSETSMDGLLGYSSYWRASYAARVWRNGHWRRVIASGRNVAVPLRDFMVYAGIPMQDIILEDDSTSTRENALQCAKILAALPGRNVLLTSDFHMFRAIRAFRKAGVEVEPLPIPDAGKRAASTAMRWSVFLDLVSESAKISYYFVWGWI